MSMAERGAANLLVSPPENFDQKFQFDFGVMQGEEGRGRGEKTREGDEGSASASASVSLTMRVRASCFEAA